MIGATRARRRLALRPGVQSYPLVGAAVVAAAAAAAVGVPNDGRTIMKTTFIATLVATAALALIAIGQVTAQHEHGEHRAGAAAGDLPKQSVLKPPPAMVTEHAHLHEQLAAALQAGGKTAEVAKKVEAVLTPHFAHEDAYALPPLGLLEPMAQGKEPSAEQVKAAIAMAEQLRGSYRQMLDEHRQLTQSLKELEAAADAENKPQAAEFARALTLHAQNEEQVLYPATLMIGQYLKLRPTGGHPEAGHPPAPAPRP
jgi:hypothetical protein